MAQENMPGTAGLVGGWNLGENGWDAGMNENLVILGALLQISVPSMNATLSTSAGVQIAPAGHEQAGKIAVYHKSAWRYFTPSAGWRVYARDVKRTFVYTSAGWKAVTELAQYTRRTINASETLTHSDFVAGATIIVNAAVDVTLTVPSMTAVEADEVRPVTIVQIGDGRVSIVGAGGVTISGADGYAKTRTKYSALSIVPITRFEHVVAGDVAA